MGVDQMRLVAALLVVLLAAPAAQAVDHTVGGTSGWTTNVDYVGWAGAETFTVGDNLVFTYGVTHSVDEVNKAGYDNCDSSKPISQDASGSTTIPLTKAGTFYYICPTPGHCSASGMKLAVTVADSSSPPATPTTPSPPATPKTPSPPTSSDTPSGGSPATPATPAGGSSSPPPPKDNGASGNSVAMLSLAIGLVVAYMG